MYQIDCPPTGSHILQNFVFHDELSQPVFRDDLLRAIRKLRILGNGFTVLTVGSLQLVQSVPGELTMDHTNVLQCAQVSDAICWLFKLKLECSLW